MDSETDRCLSDGPAVIEQCPSEIGSRRLEYWSSRHGYDSNRTADELSTPNLRAQVLTGVNVWVTVVIFHM